MMNGERLVRVASTIRSPNGDDDHASWALIDVWLECKCKTSTLTRRPTHLALDVCRLYGSYGSHLPTKPDGLPERNLALDSIV